MAIDRTPIARTIRLALRSVIGRVIDKAIGIESSEQEFSVPSGNTGMRGYQPSYWFALSAGMRGVRVHPGHAFIDLGCGKGRVLYLAAWYRFGRIVGVDLDPRMALIARRNMARARGSRRLRSIEVSEQDARTVALPDNLRVAFLFNPFVGDVFWTVASRLREHADRTGTPLRLIYANPVERGMLLRLGFVPVHDSRRCTAFDYAGSPAEG